MSAHVRLCISHVDGAAHQRSPAQGLLDDVEQVWIRLAQLVHLSDSSSEIFKPLCG